MLELLREIWSRVQRDLRSKAGDAAYDAWLGELRPLALERGVCYLEGKNRLVCERVQRLYQGLVEESLSREFGTRITIAVVPAADALVPDALEVGPARPIIDSSNRGAFLVLQALVEGKPLPAQTFFFHGPGGGGKSFLLRWWAQHAAEVPKQFTGPSLIRAFQACLRDRRTAQLQEELRAAPVLLLDEVHRISGHKRLQRELLSALEARSTAGKRVVLASRWHPEEIWHLDRGLVSYFLSGFVSRIDLPGPQARLTYLRALEGPPSRNGRAVQIEALAGDFRGGYVDLRRAWAMQREGYPHRASYLRLIDPRATFDRLCTRVAERLDVVAEDVIGKTQNRRVSFARQVLCYLCVQEGLSRAEVGRFLGGRSRAAVSYATKRLEQRMASCEDVRQQVEALL